MQILDVDAAYSSLLKKVTLISILTLVWNGEVFIVQNQEIWPKKL